MWLSLHPINEYSMKIQFFLDIFVSVAGFLNTHDLKN